jgi:hypothetical protein
LLATPGDHVAGEAVRQKPSFGYHRASGASRNLFADILRLIAELRPPPDAAPA